MDTYKCLWTSQISRKDIVLGRNGYAGGTLGYTLVHFGNFNATREGKDRDSERVNRVDSRNFNDFIDIFAMLDFELYKAHFTHRSTRGTFSRLDRFLFNGAWSDMYGVHMEVGEGYDSSDHRMVILQSQQVFSGSRPFRFELFWLEKEGILTPMKQLWEEHKVQEKMDFVLGKK